MKKTASILVVLIVLAQLGWLSVQYDTFSQELESAPHITVRGNFYWNSFVPQAVQRSVSAEDPFFGKSLWWGSSWQANITGNIYSERGLMVEQEDNQEREIVTSLEQLSNRFPTRPKPGDEVTGALELTPDSDLTLLAGFWKKGEDGLWELCRVEAIDSSEDKAHEGEQRTIVMFQPRSDYMNIVRKGDKLELDPKWNFDISYKGNKVEYTIPERHERINFYSFYHQQKQYDITIDLAIRANHAPLAREVFINGKPYREMINTIKDDLTIIAIESEQAAAEAEQPAAEADQPAAEAEQPAAEAEQPAAEAEQPAAEAEQPAAEAEQPAAETEQPAAEAEQPAAEAAE